MSVISIRGFTDRYAIYRGWAEVYHGVRLDLGGTVQVGAAANIPPSFRADSRGRGYDS